MSGPSGGGGVAGVEEARLPYEFPLLPWEMYAWAFCSQWEVEDMMVT